MRSFLTLSMALAGVATSVIAREPPNGRPVSAALEGLWSGASYTELERPDELKTLAVTQEQAQEWVARLKTSGGVIRVRRPRGWVIPWVGGRAACLSLRPRTTALGSQRAGRA